MAKPNYKAILKSQQSQALKAVQPSVKALEAGRQPLIDRYQAVLDQISGNQQAAISGQQTATSREFGKRGIPLSSGVFDTTLEERISPIRREYAGLTSETAAGREASLADLSSQIAGVRTNALQQAIEAARSLYQTRLAAVEAAKERAFKARQAALDRANQLRSASIAAAPSFGNAKGGGGGGSKKAKKGSTFQAEKTVSLKDLRKQQNAIKDVSVNDANIFSDAYGGYRSIADVLGANIKGVPSLLSSFFRR